MNNTKIKKIVLGVVGVALFLSLPLLAVIAGSTGTAMGEIADVIILFTYLALLIFLFWKALRWMLRVVFKRGKKEEHRRGAKATSAEDLAAMTQEKE